MVERIDVTKLIPVSRHETQKRLTTLKCICIYDQIDHKTKPPGLCKKRKLIKTISARRKTMFVDGLVAAFSTSVECVCVGIPLKFRRPPSIWSTNVSGNVSPNIYGDSDATEILHRRLGPRDPRSAGPKRIRKSPIRRIEEMLRGAARNNKK